MQSHTRKMRELSKAGRSSGARRGAATLPCVPPPVARTPDPLLVALARICREARVAAGRKQVHIAARLDVDQSTVARFERAGGWPQNIGSIVTAYAEELDLDQWELWQRALDEAQRS